MAEENKAMELHGEESEKKKYISDVLDIDKLIEKYGNKIMLIAGVGSGKSTWVKDVLTQKGNVLFITSRRAKVESKKMPIHEKRLLDWYLRISYHILTGRLLSV